MLLVILSRNKCITNLFSQSAPVHTCITKGETPLTLHTVNNGKWSVEERKISQGKRHDELVIGGSLMCTAEGKLTPQMEPVSVLKLNRVHVYPGRCIWGCVGLFLRNSNFLESSVDA